MVVTAKTRLHTASPHNRHRYRLTTDLLCFWMCKVWLMHLMNAKTKTPTNVPKKKAPKSKLPILNEFSLGYVAESKIKRRNDILNLAPVRDYLKNDRKKEVHINRTCK